MCYFECREAVVEGAFRYSFLLGVTSFRIGLQKNGTAIYGVAYVTGQECQYAHHIFYAFICFKFDGICIFQIYLAVILRCIFFLSSLE